MFSIIKDSAALIAPIYTLLAVIAIGLYLQSERLSSLNRDTKASSYVFKKKETFDANDPDAWKKKFAGPWTLLKREGFKEVYIYEMQSYRFAIVVLCYPNWLFYLCLLFV
jgi:hypothetical protein